MTIKRDKGGEQDAQTSMRAFPFFVTVSSLVISHLHHRPISNERTNVRTLLLFSLLRCLIVVDFTATWCGPCQMIAPHYDQLADSHAPILDMASADGASPSVIFVKVDVDKLRAAAEDYEVAAMPTFLFLKNKEVVHRFSGADVNQLVQTVEKHIE